MIGGNVSELIFNPVSGMYCHASTIAESPKGLVAAWFAGTREGAPDVGIWLARQVNGKWTPPKEVAKDAKHPCWNPVLFQPSKGPLMLFYKIGPDPRRWWGMLKTSGDGGSSWSHGRRLPEGVLGPIKNKPIELPSGEILCPSSTESEGWRIRFEMTTDLGNTWSWSSPPVDDRIEAIQPSLLSLRNGCLLALGRTRQNRVFETKSIDGGMTWSSLRLGQLPNNNSGTDAVTLCDGRHVLVYNNTICGEGQWTGPRSPLVVAVSDDGKHWKEASILEDEKGQEFSYPSVIQTRDGLVHIVYTWKRLSIRHLALDPTHI